ncbi:hypothetical protein [Nocardioides iriomotensis]|uniref:Uncharacterized protein n=1 Tax=Nocardioides iriomotensis TaxID=715784 RepID=A0A4Q5IUG4_9ACTN|nr:hypothetical protein [Nocardioides iriomotensis]RYU09492.1 hypothetical protein ETU37_20780 [Nocardioides iriomotensis]
MSWFWKGLVVLLLALPVGAYVTGSLAGAPADLPDRLEPVVVQDPSSGDTAPEPSHSEGPRNDGATGDRDDDRDDRDGRDEGDDRDEVEVVRPDPDDLDDDSDDDGRDLDDENDRDHPGDDVTDDD